MRSWLPEEPGVLEAGPEDPLVAPPDQPLGVPGGVGDPQETGQLLSVADDGEELLAFAHGRGQDLERQAEVGFGERAEDDERVLDVEGQVVEQLRVRVGFGLERSQGGLDLGEDHLLPVGGIDDDEALLEGRPVGGEIRRP